MIFSLYSQKPSISHSSLQGAKQNELKNEKRILHDVFRLQQLINSLQISLTLSSTKGGAETSRPLYSWLNEFSKSVEKLADLSEQVFSSISNKNNFDELVNQVRKIEMDFSPLILNEYISWNKTVEQLSIFTQALHANNSPIKEVINDGIPEDSSRCDGIKDLVSLFSNPMNVMHLGAFIERLEEKQFAPIVRITDSLIENIYTLLPVQDPKRIEIAYERVDNLEKIIASLQQNKSSLQEDVNFYKSRLISEQRIIKDHEKRLKQKQSQEIADLQVKAEQNQAFVESLQSQVKQVIQAAEDVNSQTAAFSHLPALVSSLTAELQQTRRDSELKLNNFTEELNKVKEEKYKVVKDLNTAKFNSKKNFFIGAFLGGIGAFISLRNMLQKPISPLNATSSPNPFNFNFANSISFSPPKQIENEVNPFDLSAGIPFA